MNRVFFVGYVYDDDGHSNVWDLILKVQTLNSKPYIPFSSFFYSKVYVHEYIYTYKVHWKQWGDCGQLKPI
mgnify:CR=1 FL=1